jgi:uncharacterized protein related to proFAR isomerase
MDRTVREKTAARIYCATLTALRDRGVAYELANEVSRILERETAIGVSYQRTENEQEIINKVLPLLMGNH